MRYLSSLYGSCLAALVFGTAMHLAGCSDNPVSSEAEDTTSGFYTAESLLSHLNQSITYDPVDNSFVLDVWYPETPIQERLTEYITEGARVDSLSTLVRRRFGGSLTQGGVFSTKPIPAARMTSNEAGRATALTRNDRGEDVTMHLVQVGEEWMLSGYTLEYIVVPPNMSPQEIDEGVGAMIRFVRAAAAVAPDFERRVRSDEFDRLEDVQREFNEHVWKRIRAEGATP